ncbi:MULTISPECIES: hypothetical protein [Spirulina sp. CCY15215]|uniref:hypothetical protein n=1 Tax=Spirulina sp. CCY15215 TaxID=2767591 RepID=UPI001951A9E7|nr:hypothetical protein [Spirulina major]
MRDYQSISYTAFLSGWWLPLIPALLSLILAAIALPFVTARQGFGDQTPTS